MARVSWFTVKSHGYGAMPSSWQGWLVTAAFLAATMLMSLLLLPIQGAPFSFGRLGSWLCMQALATIAFVLFCKSRTDEPWRWRWGQRQ